MSQTPEALPELLSTFNPRFLEYCSGDVARLKALRLELERDGFPAYVELGANRGAFLEGIARAHPADRVLGLEWRQRLAGWGRERLARRGLDNAQILHADARIAVPILFAPESVEAFFVLFPDPWWKARHAGRRLLDPIFMRILARRLRPGGRLYLKSDVFDYLHRVRACAEASQAFEPLPPELWPDETSWTRSTREHKCIRSAIPFGCGYYRRKATFETALPTEPERSEDFPVPNVIDGVDVIKGPPPVDRGRRRRRR